MDPALYKAATNGKVAILRQLVDPEDPSILRSTTPQLNTALHLAASHGHAKFASRVLELNEELLVSRNADGDTPLHLAAKVGDKEVVELLVRRALSRPQDEKHKHPLTMANSVGNTALHEAVSHHESSVAVALLEADRNCAHAHNKQMESPLDMAVREGLVQVLQKIVDFPGVEVDQEFLPYVSRSSRTALLQAVLQNHYRIVGIMLEKWPQLMDIADSSGNNALHYAAQKDSQRTAELLLRKRTDLAYGRNCEQQSPLHVAACYGSTGVIKALLWHCPDVVEMVDTCGHNSFHVSVARGQANSLRCLLRHVRPAELLNRGDSNGNTPLHLAAKMRLVHSALLLLNDQRVDPSIHNHENLTARSLQEKELRAGEMDTYVVYLWEKLKQHDSKRAREELLLPPTSFPGKRRPLNEKDFDKVVDAYFLAATLIATVTFASTFTMPGGYNQAKGIALHGNNRAFKTFVISNTVAMCSSIVVIFLLIWARQEPAILRLHYLVWSQKLTIIACLAMLLSLMTAVYITVAPTAPWPAYAVIAIGICSPGLFFVISWMGKTMINVS